MGWLIGLLILCFVLILLIRAIRFRPQEEVPVQGAPVSVDQERVVRNLQQLVQCRTVSYEDHSLENEEEFEKLRGLLPDMYPHVYATCELQRVGRAGLLFHWKGKSAQEPTVLMAHYDVVPVVEESWSKPPFDGIIEDGVLWGRGTLDTKITFSSSLEAAEMLIQEGFQPARDIYLAYGGDEEVTGESARSIVDWMEERGIIPGLVVDEGGAVVEGVFPGVKGKCALIGIAEKGQMSVEFRVTGKGGHASAPPVGSPIPRLARAVSRLENNPLSSRIAPSIGLMFDTLGRRSSFLYRMIFANLWCFKPALDMLTRRTGGELNAMMRTTCAFTQMSGSDANNVLPPVASVCANMRLIEGDTQETVMAHLKKVVNDEEVEIRCLRGWDASFTSSLEGEGWPIVTTAVRETWPEATVSPYLMLQCSDSREYNRICNKIYKFSAMELTKEERGLIHGNDERIPLEKIGKAVEFYYRLEKQC